MVYRETFLQNQLRRPQHLIRRKWIHGVSNMSKRIHSSSTEKNENRTPVQKQRCQFGPSAKNSIIPSEGDSSNNWRAEFQFDKIPVQAIFFAGRLNSKRRYALVRSFTGAMHWIKKSEIKFFNGWFNVFVINKWYFNAEFCKFCCEDCFQH